jgi:hypothetical protein
MKKMIFVLILFPLFASAQEGMDFSDQLGINPPDVQEQVLRSRMARCGRHSDIKCFGLRVYDTCDRDQSHGIYGRCYNYGQRGPEVVCGCR